MLTLRSQSNSLSISILRLALQTTPPNGIVVAVDEMLSLTVDDTVVEAELEAVRDCEVVALDVSEVVAVEVAVILAVDMTVALAVVVWVEDGDVTSQP